MIQARMKFQTYTEETKKEQAVCSLFTYDDDFSHQLELALPNT